MAVEKDDAVNTSETTAASAPVPKAPGSLKRFLREVQVELKKTTWPSKNELTKSTVVVMSTVVVVAIYLGICDIVASRLMQILGIVSGANQ